jgi:RNA polymerase sigma-70 factor (ECF subfamily)
MGTTIKGSSKLSLNPGSRLENCVTNFSGFGNIDPLEQVVPAIEETSHQSEGALAGQRDDQLLDANGVGAEVALGVLRIKPVSEDVQKKAAASDPNGSSSQAAERDLIDRVLSGHRELFMDLVRPHQRMVYATVFSLLANKEDAEDVAQDTLVKSLARLHQFRRESSFGTWLVQIAINETRMRNRKQWRVPMMSLTQNKHDEKADVPKDFEDWREIPSTVLERVEVREALVKALSSLAQHYREAFVLRDIHELSISQTSATLGISPGAVKSRLRRARLMLRDMLAPGLGQYGRLGWTSKEVRKPWE